jgi:hypothetical protein
VVNAFTQGLGPMLYGAAKGTAAAVAGMPGDIEQLARQLLLSGAAPDSYTAKNMAAQALLPTSDRVRAMLPSLPGAGPQAQYSENIGATLGQNVVGNLVAPKALPSAARMAGEGAMATGRFVAPKAGQLAEEYMVRTGGILPLDVYHGTPHTLPPTPRNPLGEFDASKIGTGEGAQAYGYGTYVAENPSVASSYKQAGVQDNFGGTAEQATEALYAAMDKLSDGRVLYGPNRSAISKDKLLKKVQQSASDVYLSLSPSKQKLADNFGKTEGSLYKVDLPDEKIAKMLDYDKHLSEQSKAVQDILLPYQKEIGGSFGTGEQTLKAIAFERRMKGLDDSPAAVAQQLKEMGIPGVQYLDAGSRNVAGGTRNFVVFPGEEKSMTILERNGQPAQMSVADQIDNINEVLKKKRKK